MTPCALLLVHPAGEFLLLDDGTWITPPHLSTLAERPAEVRRFPSMTAARAAALSWPGWDIRPVPLGLPPPQLDLFLPADLDTLPSETLEP